MPEYGQYDVPPSETMVNLGVGQPDNRKLPLDLIKKSMQHFVDNVDNKEILQYGDIPGYHRFRKKLADWLSKKSYFKTENNNENYKAVKEINENELFICNGVTHALHLIMTAHMYQDDTILVEDPSYFIMINIFKEFGLDVEAIPMDDDGINIEALEEKVAELSKTQDKLFLYTIPINHNPTGITMSNDKREKLAAICEVYNNFHILSDEVYHFLSWEDSEEEIIPLADYHPNIVTIGSFSKILAPSLRLGWIYESNKFDFSYNDETIITNLCKSGIYDSTGGTGVLSSYIVENLIDSGDLDKYIEECKDFLGSRCKTICDNLNPLKEKNLIDFNVPKGGYFVWVEVNKILADDLLKECIKNKVKFHPGWKFTSIANNFLNNIRLSVSYYDEKDLEIGIKRLNNVIENFNKIKVSVLGASGKLGSLITDELSKNNNYIYYGSIDRNMDLSKLSNNNNQVIIDVSRPEATHKLIDTLSANNLKIPLIIGTTGDLDINKISGYSLSAPVLKISNFSDGIPTLLEITDLLNKLPDDWNCRMIEKHHENKQDSPSGTAISWANKLNRPCQTESIREGEIFGEHKLILSNSNEEIVIHHTAKNRNIFASGCMKYINWIVDQESGYYDKVDFDQLRAPRIRKYSASGNILIVAEFIKEDDWTDFVDEESRKDQKLDGIIFLERFSDDSNEMKTKWTYYNRDGSQVPFCGNGVRCVGKYLSENYKEITGSLVNTRDTVSTYNIDKDNIYFDSPKPFLITSQTQVDKITSIVEQFEFLNVADISLIAVGVPHIVIDCECDIFEVDDCIIEFLSKSIMESYSSNFNINFINVIDKENFQIRTYERGVNRETGSCGSGTLASFFYLYTKTKKVSINCNAQYKSNDSMVVFTKDDGLNKFYLGGLVNQLN